VPSEPEFKYLKLGRLTGIEIINYFAFRGTFRLNLPKGENLLVYGENGAGKSSLFHTLRVFMEAPDTRRRRRIFPSRRPVLPGCR
jgi:predicted ATPase